MHKRHGHRAKPPSSRAELATKARVKPSTRLGEVKVVPEDMDRARRAKQLIEMRVGALGEFIGTLGRQANMLAERTPIVGEERNELLNEATVQLPLHVADLLQIFQRTDEQSQARALKALQDALNGVLYLGALFQRASERRKWLTRGRVKRFDTSQKKNDAIARLAGPVLKRHPRWTSHRIAGRIHEDLNQELVAAGIGALGLRAIGKRVESYRRKVEQ